MLTPRYGAPLTELFFLDWVIGGTNRTNRRIRIFCVRQSSLKMGCGASLDKIAESGTPHRDADRQSSSSSDSDEESGVLQNISTPIMDKLWDTKRELFKSPENSLKVTMDAFAMKCNLGIRDIYRALDVFGKISKTSRLDIDILSKLLVWPGRKNAMLRRYNMGKIELFYF